MNKPFLPIDELGSVVNTYPPISFSLLIIPSPLYINSLVLLKRGHVCSWN